jgi:ribosome-associated protein
MTPGPIVVSARVSVPESAIEWKAVRSSGPGGQNVNKLATKIQMWIDLSQISGLSPDEPALVAEFLKSRLDAAGRLLVSCQETRDQSQNVELCRVKVAELIAAALVRQKTRRRTRPSRASKQRRVEEKRRRSERLRDRRADE